MRIGCGTLLATVLVLTGMAVPHGLAKGKQDKTLPEYVLTAKTVAVVIDPSAGMDPDDPRGNDIARKDVETALAKWGRFETVTHPEYADLVIVIRKGHPRLADASVVDPQQNNRPGMNSPTDNGIRMGAQHGVDGTQAENPQRPQQPGMEMAPPEDMFVVYRGWNANPTNGPSAWRKDEIGGLHSHNVPVVDAFRKAVDAADKAAEAKKP